MLPNESILQVLHFTDYRTLVLAKLAASPFLRVATKYAAELARRRNFRVTFYTKWYTYDDDRTTGTRRRSVRYEPDNQASLAAACRELSGVIGPHAVAKLIFSEKTWNMPGVSVIFEAAPPLKYAEDVEIFTHDGAGDNSGAFMRNFTGTKALRLYLDYNDFRQYDWTFLREESARNLRLIKFTKNWPEDANWDVNLSVEEFIRYCTTLPRRPGGEPLQIDFAESYFSAAFGRRIIKLLKDTGCELTVRMWTRRGGELLHEESDYRVTVDNTTTRYASEKTGFVVDVKGWRIVIQSTAEVSRKKPRTSEEVLPAIPFDE